MDKIFEKLILQEFATYPENNLLYDYQLGFRKGTEGTEDVVISAVNFICWWLDVEYNAGIDGVFYNLVKGIPNNFFLKILFFNALF